MLTDREKKIIREMDLKHADQVYSYRGIDNEYGFIELVFKRNGRMIRTEITRRFIYPHRPISTISRAETEERMDRMISDFIHEERLSIVVPFLHY